MAIKMTLKQVEERLLAKGINAEVLEYFNSKTQFTCRCRLCKEEFKLHPSNVFYGTSNRTPNCLCYRKRECVLCSKEFKYTVNTQKCCEECQCKIGVKNTRSNRIQKQELVDIMGGKCSLCGYDKCIGALQFHHIDSSTKLFSIGDSYHSNEDVLLEIKKCVMLCANCHAELHYNETNPKQED